MIHLIIDTKLGNVFETVKGFNTEKAKNPKHVNNGWNHVYDSTDIEQCEKAKKAYIKSYTEYKLPPLLKTLEFYKKTKYKATHTINELELVEKNIENYVNTDSTKLNKYYLYESVAYIFDQMPSNDIIDQIVNESKSFYREDYDGYRIVDKTSETTSNKKESLKVRVTAYKENIIIETIDSNEYDTDFIPNQMGNIGCQLSNTKRLGISKEALTLLKQIKVGRDAIGDFMWDKNTFSWIGSPISIKSLKSVGDRDFRIQDSYIEIENDVSSEIIDSIESETIKTIDYKDVSFEPWIELRQYGNSYEVTITCHERRYYDNENIINAPNKNLVTINDDTTIIKMDPNDINKLKSKLNSIFNGSKFNEVDIIKYVDAFFVNDFHNNIMNPSDNYWRLCYQGTVSQLIQKLEDVDNTLNVNV